MTTVLAKNLESTDPTADRATDTTGAPVESSHMDTAPEVTAVSRVECAVSIETRSLIAHI